MLTSPRTTFVGGNNPFVGVLYTLISVARSYVVRRWFNARLHRAAEQFSKKVIA